MCRLQCLCFHNQRSFFGHFDSGNTFLDYENIILFRGDLTDIKAKIKPLVRLYTVLSLVVTVLRHCNADQPCLCKIYPQMTTLVHMVDKCNPNKDNPSMIVVDRAKLCGRFSRNIGYVTPKMICFWYTNIYYWIKMYPKINLLSFEKKSLEPSGKTMVMRAYCLQEYLHQHMTDTSDFVLAGVDTYLSYVL